jgi:hypothetical protein
MNILKTINTTATVIGAVITTYQVMIKTFKFCQKKLSKKHVE